MKNRFSGSVNSHLEGEVKRGIIISEGGTDDNPDPIAKMDGDIPNTVITDAEPGELSLNDRVKLRIDNALDNVMFGERVMDEEKKSKNKSDSDAKNFRLEFEMFGYTFTSETLASKGGAEDLADFINNKIDAEVEVERTR